MLQDVAACSVVAGDQDVVALVLRWALAGDWSFRELDSDLAEHRQVVAFFDQNQGDLVVLEEGQLVALLKGDVEQVLEDPLVA